jgi:hypothetical protein
MDVFSMEQGIWLGFVKTSEFRGEGLNSQTPPRYATALGWLHMNSQCLPAYLPVFLAVYDIFHPSDTPTSESQEG